MGLAVVQQCKSVMATAAWCCAGEAGRAIQETAGYNDKNNSEDKDKVSSIGISAPLQDWPGSSLELHANLGSPRDMPVYVLTSEPKKYKQWYYKITTHERHSPQGTILIT